MFDKLVIMPLKPNKLIPTMSSNINTNEITTTTSETSETSETRGDCSICCNVMIKTNNYCITPCGHEFCFLCMAKWKNNIDCEYTCPICRFVLVKQKEEEEEIDIEEEESNTIYYDENGNEVLNNWDMDDNDDWFSDDGLDFNVEDTNTIYEKFSKMEFLQIILNSCGENGNKTNLFEIKKRFDETIDEIQNNNKMKLEDVNIAHTSHTHPQPQPQQPTTIMFI